MGLKIKLVAQGPFEPYIIKTYGHVTFDETRTGIVSPKPPGGLKPLYADYTGFVIEKGDPLLPCILRPRWHPRRNICQLIKISRRAGPLNKDLLESAKKDWHTHDIGQTRTSLFWNNRVASPQTLTIRSRFKGGTHKNVIEGAYVKAGESLFTIADLSTVWVEAHIFEYEQNLVYEGQTVEMTLSYDPDKVYTEKLPIFFPICSPEPGMWSSGLP